MKFQKMNQLYKEVKPRLDKGALWVKEHVHALRVLGGIFFVLALLAGFVWMAGKEIEPVAFVLSLISSLLFASPSIAEYILPNRKPVREMNFDEILEFIPSTDPKKDWRGISRGWTSEHFLKEDPRLRFLARFDEEGTQNADFKEPWANCHPDKHAEGYWYNLYYDCAFLDKIILVSVDGAQASIPPPDSSSNKIKIYNYRVAQIHDTQDSLDDYIRRSGLEVEHS